MSVSREEMEELRQDMLMEAKMECDHECSMRSDIDYFLSKANYLNTLDNLLILKSEADTYNHCINELLDLMRDEL